MDRLEPPLLNVREKITVPNTLLVTVFLSPHGLLPQQQIQHRADLSDLPGLGCETLDLSLLSDSLAVGEMNVSVCKITLP